MTGIEPFQILVVEDNPADVRLIQEALRDSDIPYELSTVSDGEQAMQYIFDCDGAPRCPDLIILDINLPRRSGHEVLHALKTDKRTRSVPVIIMSSSVSDRDVRQAYESHANCYVRKPEDLDSLFRVVQSIEGFWLRTAKLPPRTRAVS